MKLPTSSKLWLSLECSGWHTIESPPVIPSTGVNKAAAFGTYMHLVAENETLRRYDQSRLSEISRVMTAEQEAVFNPHYTDEIGAPMDSAEWGASVVAIQDELFKILPPNDGQNIGVELVVVNYGPEFAMSKTFPGAGARNYAVSDIVGVYGTSDLVYDSGNDLVVVDWKTGREAVSPYANPQLIHIAKAVSTGRKPDTVVWLVIGDIRNQDLKVAKTTVGAILLDWGKIAKTVLSGSKETLKPGVHCDRCPNAGTCPALLGKVKVAVEGNTSGLSNDEMAAIAIMARKVNKEYRDLLVYRAENDPDFKCSYLTKGSNGWRLSAFDSKK